MMPTFSPGLFGMQQPDPMSGLSQFTAAAPYDPAGVVSPVAAALTPTVQPFVWRGSGDRMTDADIAAREQQDRQQIAAGADFSPVQSWTQGAARVAQALVAKLDKKHTDALSAANVAANNQAIAGLAQPGANEATIASLLADPTLSDGVHAYAAAKLKGMEKTPPKLNEFQQAMADAGIVPGSPQALALNVQRAQNLADPLQMVPGIDTQGNTVVRPMRASQIMQQGGGDPASTVPHAPVGKLTPIGGAGSGPQTFPLR